MSDVRASDETGGGGWALGLFTASAVILFGGAMTAYGVLRFNDPEAFGWAPKLLDRRLGAASAAALALACVAAAGSARLAVLRRTGLARALLVVALVAGAAAVAVGGLALPSIARGAGLAVTAPATPAKGPERRSSPAATAAAAVAPGDPAHGKSVFLKTCAACHAPDGAGVRGQGANLRASEFVKGKNDAQLLAFVKVGRQPFDPETKLHLAMPARGGNPALTDQDLADAIVHLREIQTQAASAVTATAGATSTTPAKSQAPPASGDQPQIVDGELWLPHTILAAANPGPTGSTSQTVALQKTGGRGRYLPNVRRFFSIALFMGGLHTVYLAFGLGLGAWAVAVSGRKNGQRSLAFVATYWFVIAGLGVVMLPTLYR